MVILFFNCITADLYGLTYFAFRNKHQKNFVKITTHTYSYKYKVFDR